LAQIANNLYHVQRAVSIAEVMCMEGLEGVHVGGL